MKKIIYAAILVSFSFACETNETKLNIAPVLSLKSTEGYTAADAFVAAGAKFKLGIQATANGGANLTQLLVYSNNTSVLDFAFNASTLDKDAEFTKAEIEDEKFSIIVRNAESLSDTISLNIKKEGVKYGEIVEFSSIMLGGQHNTNVGAFGSLQNGLVYLQSIASTNQSLIDLAYYYNSTDLNTLAAPGSNLTGIYPSTNSPETWEVKNTSYYSRAVLNISADAFSKCKNDSLIIANAFTDGGRKAKGLAVGQIWGIQTQKGKKGLIKVLEVNGTETGTVKIAVKIQK